MSRNELIDAYRRGRISRRTFIKGMTAVGVSAGAAAVIADGVRVTAAPGGGTRPQWAAFAGDTYPTPTEDVYPTAPATAAPTAVATTAPATQLPSTGAGDGDEGSSLWKPVAVAGAAAAAFVAAKLRKVRGAETE
jgi:hypothetical protein